jgi:cbb3-type cytochrome oxidase maturation protein
MTMEALYLLIPLSVVAVFAAAWIFLRMSDSGQFEDMDGPAWSVLHDDDRPAGAPTGDVKPDDGHAVDSGEKRNAQRRQSKHD